MNVCLAWKRGVVAAFILFLASPGGARATDEELLDILLSNGSITQEQYDHLRYREPDPAPETEAADSRVDATDPVIREEIAQAVDEKLKKEFPVKASYGSKGFRLETRDGNWQTNLQWRAQLRVTRPYQGDPRSLTSFRDEDGTSFQARRLRMKIGGHGYRPWLKYYFEVDLMPLRDADDSSATASTRVIDWRADIAKYEAIGLRVGQWKIDYNRERVDSSGRQQFVERSIINRIFTIDRQMGVQLRGHLFEGTPADLRYYAGVFNGQGRGVTNDDDNMMYVGRLQWNFLGRDLALRQTDVERTEKPTGSLSVAASTTKGRCTRWSSSGCGNLDGFASPAAASDGQFRIDQAQQGFAFKWQGFSVQQEFHWKRVEDRGPADSTNNLYGVYAQSGYFFNEIFDWFPEPLELAYRYAWLEEPNGTDRSFDNERQEHSVAANWFIAGHNNKVTLDYSYLTLDDDFANDDTDGHRVRLQWDVSF